MHSKRIRFSLTRCAVLLLLGWTNTVSLLRAQENVAATVAPPPPQGGFEIRTASVFLDYYSSTLPGGFSTSTPLLSDVAGGGSAQIGWSRFRERSSISVTYTPSYIGRVRYSTLNSLNHALSLNLSEKIAPRLTVRFSGAADYSSLAEYIFSPSTFSTVASAPSSFDELAAAVLTSKFTNNPQLGSILTSAPLLESPVRNLLYGQRMFTSAVQTSLSYSYSPRLSLTVDAGANRNEHVSGSQPGVQNAFLLPNTTSGGAGFTISYSLSPRTELSGSASTTRTSSSLYDSYSTTSLVTLGRVLGRRWFAQIHGGVGFTNPVRQGVAGASPPIAYSTVPHPSGGGTLGVKTFTTTLLASVDHTVSDAYGLGASSTSTANAGWRWRRPGASWWLESSVGWQQLQGGNLEAMSGWHAMAGFGRVIGHLMLLTQYAYLEYSGTYQRTSYNPSQNAVRCSLVWTPQASVSGSAR
jgi:hypothetical protein